LARSGRWLAAGYAAALTSAALIVWVAASGLAPVFFVQGQGGTPIREAALLLAAAMFAWVGWQMVDKFRRQSGAFYYWYGLGLGLTATGLVGVALLTVQGGILGWTIRLTQYLGGAYLFIAALMAARETGARTLSLAAMGEAWREGDFVAGLQQRMTGRWLLRYGSAVAAVAVAMEFRWALTAWVGPGLPVYITLYPAVMLAALLGGIGPGLAATVLAALAAAYWVLAPVGQFAITSPMDRLGLVIFAGMGLFMSVVAELYRRTRDKAAAYDREAALREGRVRMAAFAEATFEGIVESEAGRILDCNEQFARMLGYTVAELRGMEIARLVVPEDLERVSANVRQGQDSTVEHGVVRKDGGRIIVEAHGRSVTPGGARRHTALRDITERKRAEQALRRSEEQLHALADSMLNLAWRANGDGFITWYNRRWYEYTGTTPEQMEGWGWQSAHDPQALPKVMERWRTSIATGESFEMTFPLRAADGRFRTFLSRAQPLKDPEGRVVQWFGTNTDIDELLRAQAALRESEAQLRLAQESANVGIWDWKVETGAVDFTPELNKLYGLPSGSIKTYEDWRVRVHPDDIGRIEARRDEAIAKREPFDLEFRGRHASGEYRWISAKGGAIYNEAGMPIRVLGVNIDITERKCAEESIRASLREKEVMLKEIHHRVKNNLQVICSLVDLQADVFKEPGSRQAFADTRDRVRSMALVHEKLYQSESLERVEFAEYARSLLSSLWRVHSRSGTTVKLKLDLQPVLLSIVSAIPCGLLLNELAINALKHAFEGRTEGEVTVELRSSPDGRVVLCVRDNGVGLPAGQDWRQSPSLGLRLVQMLTKQLEGALEAKVGAGTEFQVSFMQSHPERVEK